MNLLITGANGFVGSSIVNHFLSLEDKIILSNYKIFCLVRKTSNISRLKNVSDRITFFYGDVRNKNSLIEPVKNSDIIIHSAAVLRCINYNTFYEVNHIGTKNLIETVIEHNPGIKTFIYISSQAASGPCKNFKYKCMSAECSPVSHYGKSKYLGELELMKYKDKLKIIILRPAAIYGPYDKDMFIYFQLAEKGILPVFNKNFYIQLLFIYDLVEICKTIVTNLNFISPGTYFVAEENCYNVYELKKIFSKVLGKQIKILYIPYYIAYLIAYFNELYYNFFRKEPAVFNRDKLNEIKHSYWTCKSMQIKHSVRNFDYTSLEEGIKITYQWYKSNKWL